MKIKNKGFTLIELMVTVVIIGILGAVAVPAYQDYTIRSQVTEGLSLASGAKVQVAEYYSNHGEYPETMEDLGMVSSQGKFIQETRLGENGKIIAVFGNDSNKVIHEGTISLVPAETDKGNLEWNCESSIEEKYLPTSCDYDDGLIRNIDGSVTYPDGRTFYPSGAILNPDGTISLTDEQNYIYSGIHIYHNSVAGTIAPVTSMFREYNKKMLDYRNAIPGSIEERKYGLELLKIARDTNIGRLYTISGNAHDTHIPRRSSWSSYEGAYGISKPSINPILKSDDPNYEYYKQALSITSQENVFWK